MKYSFLKHVAYREVYYFGESISLRVADSDWNGRDCGSIVLTDGIFQSSADHRSNEYECFYNVCEVIMYLVKFGKLNGDNCYDGGECTNLTITCPDELDNKNMLHQLKY